VLAKLVAQDEIRLDSQPRAASQSPTVSVLLAADAQ
jgi:hypothetical protein